MALEGTENLLSQQLSQAKEMGFTDSEIWAALEMNNPDKEKVSFCSPAPHYSWLNYIAV